METKDCCGNLDRCIPAHGIDTDDCSYRDAEGDCCGDTRNCPTEYDLSGEHCPQRGQPV